MTKCVMISTHNLMKCTIITSHKVIKHLMISIAGVVERVREMVGNLHALLGPHCRVTSFSLYS